MLAIDPCNLMLKSALEKCLNSTDPTTSLDVNVAEIDSMTIRLAAYDNEDSLICMVGSPFFVEIYNAGGSDTIERYFGNYQIVPSPLQGFDIGIVISRDAVRAESARVAELFSKIRTIFAAGIYSTPLETMLKGTPQQAKEVRFRADERVWVLPSDDRVTFIQEVKYTNLQDRSMAKIFLVEFEESKRHITNAPLIQFFPKAPPSLAAFRVADSPNSHYLSLTFIKTNFKADSAKKVESISMWLAEFKRYLTYHIHGLKGYLHSRMRKKTAGFLKVLEAAVPESLEAKTFKRVRGTRTYREETQIVNDLLLPEVRKPK
mmetsp:Transcript_31959/g.55082  ORF Transcript_31959/g.55082 Transcript_31959/m.55082 type:complete len:318 (+) Transcript_31959:31-984(+)